MNMAAINKLQEHVLREWFERPVKGCGGDPQAYDFTHELDRSLTYWENKSKFDRIVTDLCGQKAMPVRQAKQYEKWMQEAARQAYNECLKETKSCGYCDRLFSTAQFGVPAEQMKKGHITRCHPNAEPIITAEPPREYDVYEEEY